MANDIRTIEDASRVCSNNVRLIGELSELSVAVNRYGDKIDVNYIGVVNVGDSYIKIHGTTTTLTPRFKSDIENLDKLKANIYVAFENGEITKTEFSDECSIVYIMGEASSARSVRVDYISNSTNADAPRFFGIMTCVPIEVVDNDAIKVLIINNHFHNVMTFKCANHTGELDAMLNKTIDIYIDKARNDEGEAPLLLKYNAESAETIPRDIIDSALVEHDIYITTKNNG